MRLMSEPNENKARMAEFMQKVDTECVPASLDCSPENASAVTQHGTVQVRLKVHDKGRTLMSFFLLEGDWSPHCGQPTLDPRGARANRDIPRLHPRVQQGYPYAQAIHRVLRRYGQGERPVLQHGHRRREELDGAGTQRKKTLIFLFNVHRSRKECTGHLRLTGGLVAQERV